MSLYTPRTKISEFDITGDPDNDFNVLALLPDTLNREQVESKIRQNLPKFQVTCVTTEDQFDELLSCNKYDSVIKPFNIMDTVADSLTTVIKIILSQPQEPHYGPAIFFFVYKDKSGNLQISVIRTEYGGIHYEMLAFLQKCIDESIEVIFLSTLKHFSDRIMAFEDQFMDNFWEVFLKEVLT